MRRPTIGTNCWLTGIVLTVWALSSPIGTPQTTRGRVAPNTLSRNFTLASDGRGVAFTSTTPRGGFIDADCSDFIEGDEYELSCLFSHLDSPNFFASDWPTRVYSGPLPGSTPARIAAVPLRC